MLGISRFECASSALGLNALLRRTERVMWICFGLGLGMHLSLTRVGGIRTQQKAIKPITTQFVKRQPRLTKPLELKKRPRRKQRRIHRKMVTVRARGRHEGLARPVQTAHVAGSLAQPIARVSRSVWFERDRPEPRAMAEAVEGSRDPRNRVDTALELLDIQALDTGQHHALVIVDPDDERNIRGFLHLGIVYSETIEAREQELDPFPEGHFCWKLRGLAKVVDALNQYTDIRADIWPRYSFASRELFKTPWVFVATQVPFRLRESEANNMGRYLCSGGFVFADVSKVCYMPGYLALRQMFEDVLATQGLVAIRDWSLERLRDDHPVYHSYFDFDGAPIGYDASHVQLYGGGGARPPPEEVFFSYLESIPIDGRVASILSNKTYTQAWSWWGTSKSSLAGTPTRQLQFGVNLVIFALTQEGSITHRLMETLR